jgi:hypothetical protein
MTLTSSDIAPGSRIADEQVFKGFGCAGGNISSVRDGLSGANKHIASCLDLVSSRLGWAGGRSNG